MSLLLQTTLIVICSFQLCWSTSKLNAVVVVFRHGDRTPVRPYPTDPYRNRSYWPTDWGMLTNIGKRQHYELGQYFRKRYSGFLPEQYSKKDVYVRSTDVDRTLMSAEADLAGLYPPINNDIWEKGVVWQPIPIHTIPEKMDPILAGKKPCRKYDYLLKKLFKTDYFRNVSHMNHDLYAYLTRNSGQTVNDLEHLEYLYSTFFIETLYNYTLPEWAQKVFPKKMQPSAFLSFATSTYTSELARLKTGLFFNELISYFRNRTATKENSIYYAPKFLMFSAHDTTIANLLNSMGAFEYHTPPYTSTIMFELYNSSDGTFINVLYKNGTEPQPMKVYDCQFNCDIDKFEEILKPIILNLDQWESECNSLFLFDEPLNLYLLISVLLLGVFAIVILLILATRRATKSESNMYTQLPNEEYA